MWQWRIRLTQEEITSCNFAVVDKKTDMIHFIKNNKKKNPCFLQPKPPLFSSCMELGRIIWYQLQGYFLFLMWRISYRPLNITYWNHIVLLQGLELNRNKQTLPGPEKCKCKDFPVLHLIALIDILKKIVENKAQQRHFPLLSYTSSMLQATPEPPLLCP